MTDTLLKRIRWLTAFFIVGLVVSGVTAIPLQTEVEWLVSATNAEAVAAQSTAAWAHWLIRVREGLNDTAATHPFLFYGTDWLAFGHLVIALAFVGAWRDPIRNRWLFQFGMLACALVIPYALIFGAVRGIPLWWRAIDCGFGVLGFVPLWLACRWSRELESASEARIRR